MSSDGLRLTAACAWLALVVALFRSPLEFVLRPLTVPLGLGGVLDRGAPGFVVRATSIPPGGELLVDGVSRGTVPLLSNIVCREGDPVRLTVRRRGFVPWERELACREGKTLVVRARLRPN